MTPDEYRRVRELFDKAADLPPDEQRQLLARETLSPEMRQELLGILHGAADPDFMAGGPPLTDPTAPHESGLGIEVGRYRLIREIGHGGMGVVYLAVRSDDTFKKTVAVKIIRSGIVDAEYLARFRRERQILAGLDHPYIARIIDGGDTDDGRPFFVMEYVPGPTLDEHCRRTAADASARLRLVMQICEAVEYLHDHAVVHRDIKPGNVLISADGRPRLVDFGIAGIQAPEGVAASASPAGRNTRLLTPGFAAPEQIDGQPASKASDIYALGVMAYVLLTAQLPFRKTDGSPDIARQLSGDDPEAPSEAAHGGPCAGQISRDLDLVILRAIKRDPARRYATARELREDLERAASGRAVVAHADTWRYRAGKTLRRHPLPAALAAAIVLLAGVSTYLAVRVRLEQAKLQTQTADFDRVLASLNHQLDDIETGAAPVERVTAVVQEAVKVVDDPSLQAAALQGNEAMVSHVVTGVRDVLARADRIASAPADVRKEISNGLRQVGDFQLAVVRTSGYGSVEAIDTYQQAAAVARRLPPSEISWTQTQLANIAGRLAALNSRLEADRQTNGSLGQHAPAPAPALPAPAASSRPAMRPSASPPAAPTAAPVVLNAADEARRRQLSTRLEHTTSRAAAAQAAIAALNSSLEKKREGQTVRADIADQMLRTTTYLEEAKRQLDAGELDTAEESMRKADYVLGQLRPVTGS